MHFYSAENVGLYLVNPDYEKPSAPAIEKTDPDSLLSQLYYSDCDSMEAQLSLFPEGVAVFEIFEWNERTNRESKNTLDGEWHASEAAISIEVFDHGVIDYNFTEFSGRDDYGRFRGIDLTNTRNNTTIESCNFRYIVY